MRAKTTVEIRLKKYNFFLVEVILFLGLNKLTNTNTINPKSNNKFTISIPPQIIFYHKYPKYLLMYSDSVSAIIIQQKSAAIF
jgi:hypothetical protein